MQDSVYEKFMFNLINYKQLKCAYDWNKTNELSLKEFIKQAIEQGADCKRTELCIYKVWG